METNSRIGELDIKFYESDLFKQLRKTDMFYSDEFDTVRLPKSKIVVPDSIKSASRKEFKK